MSDAAQARPDGIFRLIYRSRNLVPADRWKTDVGAIFVSARSFNYRNGITGALLVTPESFVQALEGEEAEVRALYTRIAEDSRHDSVEVVDTQEGVERVFHRWAMARVGDDGEADVPLLADRKRGVAPAAGHKTSEEEEALLDRMRGSVQTSTA